MAKRLLNNAPELNQLGRYICMVISVAALALFAFTANANSVKMEDVMSHIYSIPLTQELRKGNTLFKAPTPKPQTGASVNNPWKPQFKANRYMAHHVYFERATCWLNIAVARAKEQVGRDVKVYYDADSVFVVHFRNTKEATAALNILLQGENVELPPYWVEKEV